MKKIFLVAALLALTGCGSDLVDKAIAEAKKCASDPACQKTVADAAKSGANAISK